MSLVDWVAVVLMLSGGALLVLGVSGTAIWFAIILLGISLVAIDLSNRREHHL